MTTKTRLSKEQHDSVTTRLSRATEIRNSEIREARDVLVNWRDVPKSVRVEIVTRIMIDSCKTQAKLLGDVS